MVTNVMSVHCAQTRQSLPEALPRSVQSVGRSNRSEGNDQALLLVQSNVEAKVFMVLNVTEIALSPCAKHKMLSNGLNSYCSCMFSEEAGLEMGNPNPFHPGLTGVS